MDNMLEMYLYETNTLLEQLDELLIEAEKNEDFTLKVNQYKRNLERLYELILEGKVISASSVKFGGVAETISKMAFGNKIGVEFFNLSKEELLD